MTLAGWMVIYAAFLVFFLLIFFIVPALFGKKKEVETPDIFNQKTAPTATLPGSDEIIWEAFEDEDFRYGLRHDKVLAVKRYQHLTGAGYMEAKHVVDIVTAYPEMVPKTKSRDTSRLIDTEGAGVRDLIAAGKLDEAAAVYAQFMGVDEYTARDAITVMAEDVTADHSEE